ncbi:peptidylprolyl isomerase [Tenacibaculum maritimum]|uniref:peptidylprolyl isomerase n=1 Tax=Tenacibaculum maritimum TaxID=107401 RepID=UPI00388E0A2F
MRFYLFLISLFTISTILGQEEVLFTINETPITIAEFKRVYEKNLDLVQDSKAKDIDGYLELYINFKLKVQEAYKLKLDEAETYKRELESYKKQLMLPYLQDPQKIAELVKEAYYRTKNEVKASHIVLSFPKGMKEKDTLSLYRKIEEVRNRVLKGEAFEKVALEVSDDPSVKRNLGNLGYFSAFKMVYPFETAAYNTEKGALSKPFKTRFGYHILKVHDKKLSEGEVEVAHIFVEDKSIVGKSKLDSVYQELKRGEAFDVLAKKYSQDRKSAVRGGRLAKFGRGIMVEKFERVAYEIPNEGGYSEPFKTKYGWHIIQLIKKYPIASFEELKGDLEEKIKKGNRGKLSDKSLLNKLKKSYKITVNKEALALFEKSDRRTFPKDSMQEILLSINEKRISQEDFSSYIKIRKYKGISVLLKEFVNQEILKYFKENLVHTVPEYRNTLNEYKEGLLLFDLMKSKIWDASAKDTLGLKKYFLAHKPKYAPKKLRQIRGIVMSDYQKYLEEEWVKGLKQKNVINVRRKQLKKLKKEYNQ